MSTTGRQRRNGVPPGMSEDLTTMVAALRAALDAPSAAGRPGQLRLRLEAELGAEDAQRLRRLVHQVVGAAEENLPANLRRIAPLTSESLHRLSGELAAARGWTPEAAQRATQIWAAALGFEELVASSWPREPGPPATGPVEPAPPAAGPVEPTPAAAQVTALPPDPVPQEPAVPRPRPEASAPQPAPAARPEPDAGAGSGGPAVAVRAYAGISLVLCVALFALLVVAFCVPIAFLGVEALLLVVLGLPVFGTLLLSLLARQLRRGVLVASPEGLQFTPYDPRTRSPRADQSSSAPWGQVTVQSGFVTRYRFAGSSLQVGPWAGSFVAAAGRYSGGRAA